MNNKFSKYYGYIDLLNYLIEKDKIQIEELEHIKNCLIDEYEAMIDDEDCIDDYDLSDEYRELYGDRSIQ